VPKEVDFVGDIPPVHDEGVRSRKCQKIGGVVEPGSVGTDFVVIRTRAKPRSQWAQTAAAGDDTQTESNRGKLVGNAAEAVPSRAPAGPNRASSIAESAKASTSSLPWLRGLSIIALPL